MSWKEILEAEFSKEYFTNISSVLKEESKHYEIYPPKQDIFQAFELCPIESTKAIILGMDPYSGYGQAHGLSFSVKPGIKVPPSLKNIFKELKNDLNINPPNHGCLLHWAKQGVLLLNSALTVRAKEPGSHIKLWELFTKNILKFLNQQDKSLAFILWGSFAKQKKYLINNEKHLCICGNHPSPLSANCGGFFGGKYFSKTNEFLIKNNQQPIDWFINSI